MDLIKLNFIKNY